MRTSIRIGIVGAGGIVRSEHVPRFRAIDGVEIVAVANRTLASSRRAAADLAIDRSFDDWHALVADPDIDAILVGAWPYLHAPVTIEALEAGKHVLTEARMAATGEAARAMLRASRARPDLVAMVVPASFSLWADATIGRLLADRAIGRLRHARIAWDASGPDHPAEAWRWQRRYSGENIMALGILYEATSRWFGRATAVTAVTRSGRPVRPGPEGDIEVDIPDHVLAIVEFPDDVTATIEMSVRTNPLESNRAILYGTDGTLRVDFTERRIDRAPLGGDWAAVEIEDADRADWTAELDFVAAIRGERPVTLTDFATGAHYMAVVEAVDRSAAHGRREPVASVE
jgi:predicted dehydrogenase